MRTLVLDQGYQPHGIVTWQKAISLLYVGKVDVVEEYADVIRSVSMAMKMPAVIRLRRAMRHRPYRLKFSRLNVMRRDGFSCQYCRTKAPVGELTYDHVVPRAQGGRTCWENIVTACRECNHAKADRTPKQAGMPLAKTPVRPTWLPAGGVEVDERRVPDSWKSWLSLEIAA